MSVVIAKSTSTSTSTGNPKTKRNVTRQVTPYSCFQKDLTVKSEVKSSLTTQLGKAPDFGQMSKGMKDAWAALTDKSVYETQAVQANSSQGLATPKTSQNTKDPKEAKAPKTKTTNPKKRKRGRSAYILYTMDPTVKDKVKADHPNADFAEMSKILGGLWKALSTEERQPYEEASKMEKVTIAQTQAQDQSQDQTQQGVTKTRKRARSAYTLYSSDPAVREAVRQAHPDADFGSLSKFIGEKWKTLTEEEREPYQKANAAEKQQLAEAMAQEAQDPSQNPSKGKGKVRKRARSAYTLYTMDPVVKETIKKANPDATFADFSKLLSQGWKELSPEDKTKYEEASAKEKTEMSQLPPQTGSGTEKKPKQQRAKSAYTLYSSNPEIRTQVKQANPDADFGAISKIIAEQWKGLTEDERKPYETASATEKEALNKAKAANKPKKTRAKSAYLHYSLNVTVRNAAKQANPDLKVTELAKVLGAQWKALSEEDRQPFILANQQEKEALANELKPSSSDEA